MRKNITFSLHHDDRAAREIKSTLEAQDFEVWGSDDEPSLGLLSEMDDPWMLQAETYSVHLTDDEKITDLPAADMVDRLMEVIADDIDDEEDEHGVEIDNTDDHPLEMIRTALTTLIEFQEAMKSDSFSM